MRILSLLRSRFEQALTGWVDQPAEHAQRVTLARDPQFGDYQANIAMPLQKTLAMKPQEIAQQLCTRLNVDDICEPPQIAGPGFINLRIKNGYLAECVREIARDERVGVRGSVPKTYMVDYSSPNVAKPMHVGHIRSTVIGDALVKILRFLGHRVISDNHLGDWGTQFGMVIYGFKHFRDEEAFKLKPVAELSRLYRLVQQIAQYQGAKPKIAEAERLVQLGEGKVSQLKAIGGDPKAAKQMKEASRELGQYVEDLNALREKIDLIERDAELLKFAQLHENIETRAQLETAKLHGGDSENLALWRQFLPICIEELEGVYRRLKIVFDLQLGESYYHPMLQPLVDKLVENKLAVESDGALCIFLPSHDAPMLIRKSDGAFLYATTDLATIEYRIENYKPDAILYVVDHRQSEHFVKLFDAAKAIGFNDVELKHISFGTVLGPDGKPFKTRSGTVIGLEYLLDEAVDRAYQVVCNPERMQKAGLAFSPEEQKQIAETIGLGAIKFADLIHNRTSDYEFNIEKMVQLDGCTSAYIQYGYARVCGILRNAEVELNDTTIGQIEVIIGTDAEHQLAMTLVQFEDTLQQSVDDYFPSVLAAYLYNLTKAYSAFFDQCPVLKADTESLKYSRLLLCHATGQVLKKGLSLLGIDTVPRM